MMKKLCLAVVLVWPMVAREPLAQRIVHTEPAKYRASKAVHDGEGTMQIGSLLESGSLDTNLYFVHRGVIPPKTGIGHHFHNRCEEMFIIFDGEAQFTIDGRTSRLQGPAGAPCRMGHSHAVYNPGDTPVQWMNINVAAMKGSYDAFNLGDSRADVQLDPIPTFMTMRLDRTLLRPISGMNGGTGTAQYRRALDTSVFLGPWAYMDHLVLPPSASSGAHLHREVAEADAIVNGRQPNNIPLPTQTGSAEARVSKQAKRKKQTGIAESFHAELRQQADALIARMFYSGGMHLRLILLHS